MHPSVLYLIEDGGVRLLRWEGNQQIVMMLRFRPWLLGGPALVGGRPVRVSAETAGRCRLRHIDGDALKRLLQCDPLVLWDLAVLLAQDVDDLFGEVADLCAVPARQRLEATIYLLAKRFGHPCKSGVRLLLPMTLDELAQAVHVTPQWRSHFLAALERDGLIVRQKGQHLVVPDPDKLWHGDDA